MSQTTLNIIKKTGTVVPYKYYSNSHQGCMYVWTNLAKKYVKKPEENYELFIGHLMIQDEFKSVWALAKDPRLTRNERITLVSTFDNCICEQEKMSELADAFDDFAKMHPGPTHLTAQAADIREISDDIIGICWQQTSVIENPWRVCENIEDDEGREYDITKDQNHWFLFKDNVES